MLQSVEALCSEESTFKKRNRTYIPAIVTAANLKVCTSPIDSVSLENGEIGVDDAIFEKVPYVRFRKGLASGHRMPSMENLMDEGYPHDIKEANQAKERTIFIVQAKALSEFLENFNPAVGERLPHFNWN